MSSRLTQIVMAINVQPEEGRVGHREEIHPMASGYSLRWRLISRLSLLFSQNSHPGTMMSDQNPYPGDICHSQIPVGYPTPPPPFRLAIDRCISRGMLELWKSLEDLRCY